MINYMAWSIAGWHTTPASRISKKKPQTRLHLWLRSRGDIVFFRLCAGDPTEQPSGFVNTLPLMAHLVPGIELHICSNCLNLIKQEGQEIDGWAEGNEKAAPRLVDWLYHAGHARDIKDPFSELPFALSLAMDEILEAHGIDAWSNGGWKNEFANRNGDK